MPGCELSLACVRTLNRVRVIFGGISLDALLEQPIVATQPAVKRSTVSTAKAP